MSYLRGIDGLRKSNPLVSQAIDLWLEYKSAVKCATLISARVEIGEIEACGGDAGSEAMLSSFPPSHPVTVLRDIVARETIALWTDIVNPLCE